MDKIVLFGAGQKGRQLLGLYGDNVVAIIDNDVNKQGTTITEGTNTVPVISIKKYIQRCSCYTCCFKMQRNHKGIGKGRNNKL